MDHLFCPFCGKRLPDGGSAFCPFCGKELSASAHSGSVKGRDGGKSALGGYVNDFVGNPRSTRLNWKVLFTDVLKKHSIEEGERIFISGTKLTTPSPETVSSDWPHPWLYFRVFLTFLAAYVLLFLGCDLFGNINLLPGLIIVGALLVPISAVMLFIEMNVFRNVSIYRVFQVFLIGGCASLFFTLVLFSFITPDSLDYSGALITGIVEEVGKAVIIFLFLRRLSADRILTGLLIGATVGAGFAAFETAGYGLRVMIANGWESMLQTLFLRNILAPGGHIAWGAISGAAVIIAGKGEYSIDRIFSGRFFRLFAIPVILHFLWDSPVAALGADYFLVYIILIVIVWAFVLSLIDMGLSEVPSPSYPSNRIADQ